MFIHTHIYICILIERLLYFILVSYSCNVHDVCIVNPKLQYTENSKIRFSSCK